MEHNTCVWQMKGSAGLLERGIAQRCSPVQTRQVRIEAREVTVKATVQTVLAYSADWQQLARNI